MSFPEQSVPPSKRKALAEIRVLAELGGEILILESTRITPDFSRPDS
jgi:hypothetical protein